MPSPFKAVSSYTFDYQPYARCDTSGCVWEHAAGFPATVLRDVKAHIEQTGHEVLIIRENHRLYRGETR